MKDNKNKNHIFSRHVQDNLVSESQRAENLQEIVRRMKAAAQMPAIDPVIDRKLEQMSCH